MLKQLFRGVVLVAWLSPLAACSSETVSGDHDETDVLAPFRCLADNPTSSDLGDERIASTSEALDPGSCGSAPVVQVYIHHLMGRVNGQLVKSLPQSTFDGVVSALNGVYRSTTFKTYRFVLAGVTQTENNEWYGMVVNPGTSSASPSERAAKQQLRRGGRTTLNIYTGKFVNQFGEGVVGSATAPSRVAGDLVRDGVLLHHNWISVGPIVIHEVGHWLGLLHPYERGCIEPGDGVADTPLQLGPLANCSPSDSCPFSPGVDPVSNYMNVTGTTTSCLTKLTNGQRERVDAQYQQFRCAP